jgi:hypothetical protein
MVVKGRRGGVGTGPGRALVQAGLACFVAAGCTTDPPPALLTVVDVPALAMQDSRLLPDSTKAAIRSYIARVGDEVWSDGTNPELEKLVGGTPGFAALLDATALPRPGRTTSVVVDVPGEGAHEFRLTRVADEADGRETYTGQARGEPMAILLVRDSVAAGRITTAAGVFNFRSARYGLITIAPIDTTGSLPELHLISTAGAVQDSCYESDPNAFGIEPGC